MGKSRNSRVRMYRRNGWVGWLGKTSELTLQKSRRRLCGGGDRSRFSSRLSIGVMHAPLRLARRTGSAGRPGFPPGSRTRSV
eukprot:280756-Prorocentrum_minimum.AAC.1